MVHRFPRSRRIIHPFLPSVYDWSKAKPVAEHVAELRHPKRRINLSLVVVGCRRFQRMFKESGLWKKRCFAAAYVVPKDDVAPPYG